MINSKKKLFCAFVDFKQAFDTVWRDGLWYKLLKSGINGKCFTYIKNMYKGIKSKILMVFHLIFLLVMSVYDREKVYLHSCFLEKELFLYLKMFILFYADDTVILAESANDLQFALNEFYRYCDT